MKMMYFYDVQTVLSGRHVDMDGCEISVISQNRLFSFNELICELCDCTLRRAANAAVNYSTQEVVFYQTDH